MLRQDPWISLADLSAAGVVLSRTDAVTIVRELILRVARGDLPGVPSAHVIRFSASGQLAIEGPVAAGSRPISRSAQLLESLLPRSSDADTGRDDDTRTVISRARDVGDDGYPSLESFADALAPLAAEDVGAVIRDLTNRWSAVAAMTEIETHDSRISPGSGAGPVTISDVRRARRATGIPLAAISARSRIPVSLLRQLEWGYLRNWPSGLYGRTQLVRYARASGLDEHMVLEALRPILPKHARPATSGDVLPQTLATPPSPQSTEIAIIPLGDFVPQFAEEESTVAEESMVAEEPSVPVETFELLEERPLDRDAVSVIPPTRKHRRQWLSAAAAVVLAAGASVIWIEREGRARDLVQALQTIRVDRFVPDRTSSKRPQPATEAPVGDSRTAVVERPRRSDAVQTSEPTGADLGQLQPGVAATAGEAAAAVEARREPLVDGTVAPGATSEIAASVGTAMFYETDDASRNNLVHAAADLRTSTLRVLRVVEESSRSSHAQPSPDGAHVAFDSDRDGDRAVYVADAEGQSVRKISGDGFAAMPSWSPDGRSIAFIKAEPDSPRVWNLWLTELESGRTRQLTSHLTGQIWGGSWFPDGERIAFSHEGRLVVLDVASGREQSYPSPKRGWPVRSPSVSPNGERVMFHVYYDGAWLLDLKDGSMRKVLADSSAEGYTWSPDGRRVAYHSRRGGGWNVLVLSSH